MSGNNQGGDKPKQASLFGAPNPALFQTVVQGGGSTLFGSTSTTTPQFAQASAASGAQGASNFLNPPGGLFGSNPLVSNTTPGAGLFGSVTAQANAASLFQSQPTPTNQPAKSGETPKQAQNIFGQSTNQPAFGFVANQPPPADTKPAQTTNVVSSFGAAPQQPAASSSVVQSNLFGANKTLTSAQPTAFQSNQPKLTSDTNPAPKTNTANMSDSNIPELPQATTSASLFGGPPVQTSNTFTAPQTLALGSNKPTGAANSFGGAGGFLPSNSFNMAPQMITQTNKTPTITSNVNPTAAPGGIAQKGGFGTNAGNSMMITQPKSQPMQIDTSSKKLPVPPKITGPMRKFKEIVLFKDQGDKLPNIVRGIDQNSQPTNQVIRSVIEDFSQIYGRQFNPEDGLVSEDSVETTANEYVTALQNKVARDQSLTDIINIWTLFDTLHLSSSRSEMIRKLVQCVNQSESVDSKARLYADLERMIHNEKFKPEDYGILICHLMAMGEFQHIPNFLKKSIYFNQQDRLVEGFLEGLRDFTISLSGLVHNHEFNYEIFNKALIDLQGLVIATKKSIENLVNLNRKLSNLHVQIQFILRLIEGDDEIINGITERRPNAKFMLSLMFAAPNKFNNDPKFVGLAKSIYTDRLYEILDLKPLKYLEALDKKYPPFLSFHLRELYLRKNLPFDESKCNFFMFKQINDEYLQEYFSYLMETRVDPRQISPYLQSLEEDQQTQMMKVIIQYCQSTLKKNAKEVSEFVNYLIIDPAQTQLKEMVAEVETKQAQEIMNSGELGEAISFMLKMTRPDLLIQTSFQYLEGLISGSSRSGILNDLKQLDQSLTQEDMKQLREVSPNFNFMFEYLYFTSACDNKQDSIIQSQLRNFIFNLNIPQDLYFLLYETIQPLLEGNILHLDQDLRDLLIQNVARLEVSSSLNAKNPLELVTCLNYQ